MGKPQQAHPIRLDGGLKTKLLEGQSKSIDSPRGQPRRGGLQRRLRPRLQGAAGSGAEGGLRDGYAGEGSRGPEKETQNPKTPRPLIV